jgi:hypothetical protein
MYTGVQQDLKIAGKIVLQKSHLAKKNAAWSQAWPGAVSQGSLKTPSVGDTTVMVLTISSDSKYCVMRSRRISYHLNCLQGV